MLKRVEGQVSEHFRVGLIQLAATESKKDNLERVVSTIESSEKSDLLVFPEYCMGYTRHGLTRQYLHDLAEPLSGEFVTEVAKLSEEKKLAIILPIFERAGDEVFNTAVILDQGKVKGGYRKIHLFDALGYRESDLFRAGSDPVIFKLRNLTIGLVICYDIRFPELVKEEVMSGARVVIAPSAWFRGPLKEEQWQTLLIARAHENTSYLVGVGNAHEAFVGRSIVVDPQGVKVMDLGVGDNIGYCQIDDARVTEAREKLPVLQQSKPLSHRCQVL